MQSTMHCLCIMARSAVPLYSLHFGTHTARHGVPSDTARLPCANAGIEKTKSGLSMKTIIRLRIAASPFLIFAVAFEAMTLR